MHVYVCGLAHYVYVSDFSSVTYYMYMYMNAGKAWDRVLYALSSLLVAFVHVLLHVHVPPQTIDCRDKQGRTPLMLAASRAARRSAALLPSLSPTLLLSLLSPSALIQCG